MSRQVSIGRGFSNPDGYLKSVQSGGQALTAKSLEVTEGPVIDVVLLFSKDWASVSGDVDQPSSHVVLISQDESGPPQSRYLWPDLDQSNRFSIAKLRPGKYLAFAAEDDDRGLWDNPEFVKALQSEGSQVEALEKSQAAVHLKLILKDETDRIAKRLGL